MRLPLSSSVGKGGGVGQREGKTFAGRRFAGEESGLMVGGLGGVAVAGKYCFRKKRRKDSQ